MILAHLDKVLRHAEEKLAGRPHLRRSERLALYRNFLKIEEHRLKLAHRAGEETGVSLTHKRADLVTVLLQHLWQHACDEVLRDQPQENLQLTLAAVGGFGRRELSPASDVDILFLYADDSEARSQLAQEIAQKILYSLWDIGLQVGHATRTLSEAIEQANVEWQTKTALLESRCIAGDEVLWRHFQTLFAESCVRGQQATYIRWRVQDDRRRHQKQGSTVFLQEPNVKQSAGGLRDYHSLAWASRVAYGPHWLAQITTLGFASESELKQLAQGYDFILRVRNALHYQQRRGAGDILTLQLQGVLAKAFGYPQRSILRRIESFMRDYYRHAHAVGTFSHSILQQISAAHEPTPVSNVPVSLSPSVLIEGFLLQNGQLDLAPGMLLHEDPTRMVRAFQIAQQHNATINPALLRDIRRQQWLLNSRLLQRQDVRDMLLAIFAQKGTVGRTCRQMHEIGLLGRLVPPFAPLHYLVQHEFFHRYTADEHTLQCLEALDSLIDPQSPAPEKYRTLAQGVEKPAVLYLAMLLHDTGRANNKATHAEGSAAQARMLSKRWKLDNETQSLLEFLVQEHGLLAVTGQRRNIDDPETIRAFARRIRTRERLDLLMLVTFADLQAVQSAANRSEWKEMLHWQLYHRTAAALSGETEFVQAAEESLSAKQASIRQHAVGVVSEAEVEAHLQHLPARYFMTLSQRVIMEHLQLIHQFFLNQMLHHLNESQPLQPVVRWNHFPHQGHSEVMVTTWDRARSFVRTTQAFTRAGLSILSADIFTRSDNIVVDTFRVCTLRRTAVIETQAQDRFEAALAQSFGPDSVPADMPNSDATNSVANARFLMESAAEMPTRVRFHPAASENQTVLDIETADRPGLLFTIASWIADQSLRVEFARITTEKGAAFDTFYLSDSDNNKITDRTRLATLTQSLAEKLRGGPSATV